MAEPNDRYLTTGAEAEYLSVLNVDVDNFRVDRIPPAKPSSVQ